MINVERTTPNKSMIYLLPILGINKVNLFFNLINNTYLRIENINNLENGLHLVYRFHNKNYEIIESRLLSHRLCVNSFQLDKYHDCYSFDLSDYKETYNHFKKGHYHKFDDNYKNEICKFYELTSNTEIFQSLHLEKQEQLRKKRELTLGMILPKDINAANAPDLNKELFKEADKYQNPISPNIKF